MLKIKPKCKHELINIILTSQLEIEVLTFYKIT